MDSTHNPKVLGSNPSPATNEIKGLPKEGNPFFIVGGPTCVPVISGHRLPFSCYHLQC